MYVYHLFSVFPGVMAPRGKRKASTAANKPPRGPQAQVIATAIDTATADAINNAAGPSSSRLAASTAAAVTAASGIETPRIRLRLGSNRPPPSTQPVLRPSQAPTTTSSEELENQLEYEQNREWIELVGLNDGTYREGSFQNPRLRNSPLFTPTEPQAPDLEPVEVVEVVEEPLPPPLKFMSTWRLRKGPQQKDVINHHSTEFEELDITWYGITSWTTAQLQALAPREFRVRSYQFICSHRHCVRRNRFFRQVEVNDFYGLREIEAQLRRWRDDGHVELRADIDITVDEIVVAASSTALQAARPSATAIQIASLASQLRSDRLETRNDNDNLKIELGLRWPCKNTSCRNYGHSCWIRGSDIPHNHYPIDAVSIRRWIEDIRGGESSLDKPSSDVLILLSDRKSRLLRQPQYQQESQPATATSAASTPVANTPVIVMPQLPQMPYPSPYIPQAPQPSHFSTRQRVIDPPSSPIRVDFVDELRNEFIAWLRRRRGWANEADLVSRIQVVLRDENYDIDGIKTITEAVWVDVWGFRRGELSRLQQEVRPFKLWWASRG